MSACDRYRDRLLARTGDEDASHPNDCTECGHFLHGLEAVHRELVEHHASAEPDAQFAARVAARIARSEPDALAWAAGRFLPVGLGLLALLVVLSLTPPASEPEAPSSILAWLASGEPTP